MRLFPALVVVLTSRVVAAPKLLPALVPSRTNASAEGAMAGMAGAVAPRCTTATSQSEQACSGSGPPHPAAAVRSKEGQRTTRTFREQDMGLSSTEGDWVEGRGRPGWTSWGNPEKFLGRAVSPVSFGSHLFDSARCMLLRDGEALPLTRKAFLLLELLIQRRPAVVSKKEILERLWPDCFVEEGNIASLISEIRAALGGSAIRTVHGVGYAFTAEASERLSPLRPTPLGMARALLIERGPPPRDIELPEGVLTLGRGATCQVRATSPTVSRHHA